MLGQSAVLDCLVTDAVVADWSEHVAEFDAQLYIAECTCSDEDLHRGRVDRLSVDAGRPLEENHQGVLGYIAD